jgi:hypothetical protein
MTKAWTIVIAIFFGFSIGLQDRVGIFLHGFTLLLFLGVDILETKGRA